MNHLLPLNKNIHRNRSTNQVCLILLLSTQITPENQKTLIVVSVLGAAFGIALLLGKANKPWLFTKALY
ncbi:17439_t:CDS:1, partial [Entrophospora sp. SA101]